MLRTYVDVARSALLHEHCYSTTATTVRQEQLGRHPRQILGFDIKNRVARFERKHRFPKLQRYTQQCFQGKKIFSSEFFRIWIWSWDVQLRARNMRHSVDMQRTTRYAQRSVVKGQICVNSASVSSRRSFLLILEQNFFVTFLISKKISVEIFRLQRYQTFPITEQKSAKCIRAYVFKQLLSSLRNSKPWLFFSSKVADDELSIFWGTNPFGRRGRIAWSSESMVLVVG